MEIGRCHCGVALVHHGEAISPTGPVSSLLDLLAAGSPSPPTENGSEAVTLATSFFFYCDSQNLAKTLPHAGIMTMRECFCEVRSHTPQPVSSSFWWKRTSTTAAMLPVDPPLLGCVGTESSVLPFSVPGNCAQTRAAQLNPEDVDPLLTHWQ